MKKITDTLFSEFPGVPRETWIEKIRSDLKDPGAMERLVWKSEEGFDVDPFYRPEDLTSLDYLDNLWARKSPATAPNGWINCQEIILGKDPALSGEQMMDALKGGAQSICIRFTGSPNYGFKELQALLDQIPLAETEIIFKGGMQIDALYDHLCELAGKHNVEPGHLKGGLGADPLGYMIGSGYPIASLENLEQIIRKVSVQSPALKTMDLNGGHFQNAGSTLVQELAFSLAMASEYMAILSDRGIDPVMIQGAMRLSLTSGPHYFMEIAKLRAARILWSQLAGAFGIKPADARIILHSTTAGWNQTLYDPYVNMLRGTSEAMAAVIGGADYVTVLPFDTPSGKTTSFSQRIARNVSIILREEAYLDKVADPASGSWYLEKLTHELGERAWDLFREVEARGGFRKASESGWIQQEVRRSGQEKHQKVSNGMKKLIGTNAFPDPNETGHLQPKENHTQALEHAPLVPLIDIRPSSSLEEIRMKVEQRKPRPRVFLLKYGIPGWALSRAAFAYNFFASGGYALIDPPLFDSIKDGVKLAIKSHAEIVVFCSSDEQYKQMASEAGPSLTRLPLIVVAGDPSKIGDSLEDLGIHHFIHRHSPLMKTLQVINSIVLK